MELFPHVVCVPSSSTVMTFSLTQPPRGCPLTPRFIAWLFNSVSRTQPQIPCFLLHARLTPVLANSPTSLSSHIQCVLPYFPSPRMRRSKQKTPTGPSIEPTNLPACFYYPTLTSFHCSPGSQQRPAHVSPWVLHLVPNSLLKSTAPSVNPPTPGILQIFSSIRAFRSPCKHAVSLLSLQMCLTT